MIKTETKEIEGLSITCTQLPAMRAYAVFTRLGKVLGPALQHLSSLQNIGEQDISAVGPALSAALSGMSEDIPLVTELLASTQVVTKTGVLTLNQPPTIDAVFSGNFKAFLMTLKFAMEVNFGDFFGGLSAGEAGTEGNK